MSDKTVPAVRSPALLSAISTLDKLLASIPTAPTIEALRSKLDTVAGIKRVFKGVKEVSDRAGECQIAGDVTVDAHLKTRLPVARGRLKGKDITGKSIVAPRTDPNLKDLLGPNAKNWAARAHAIAAIPEPKRRTYITEIKDEGRTITSEVLLSVDRASRKETVRQTIVKGKFSKDGPFGTVILDPPWPMQKMERRTFTNSAEFEYPVMAVEDITALLKKDIVPKLEKDCHMFMWTTEKFLPVAIAMVGELGFEYVLTMVWHKNGGVQPFGLPQFNCEFVVYARRGTPRFVDFKNFMCCFEAKRREPGRKPDEFAATIRRVTGGSRLVVFARTSPEGFACYGNEVDKFKTE